MPSKSEYLVDLIFKKLKNYKDKEILLEKESFKKFISSLLKENWSQEEVIITVIVKIFWI